MSYVKTYNIDGKWVTAVLSDEAEKEADENCRETHIRTMRDCIFDAKLIGNLDDKGMLQVAIAFFNKRAIKLQVEREKIARKDLGMEK